MLVNPVHNSLKGTARREDLSNAHGLEFVYVFFRNDSTAHQHDIIRPLGLQQIDDLLKQIEMSGGQAAQANQVHIFLDGGADNLPGCLMKTRIDDLKTGVSKCPGNNARTPVMAVEAGFCYEYSDFACHELIKLEGSWVSINAEYLPENITHFLQGRIG